MKNHASPQKTVRAAAEAETILALFFAWLKRMREKAKAGRDKCQAQKTNRALAPAFLAPINKPYPEAKACFCWPRYGTSKLVA
jgi:hypothetical protein